MIYASLALEEFLQATEPFIRVARNIPGKWNGTKPLKNQTDLGTRLPTVEEYRALLVAHNVLLGDEE